MLIIVESPYRGTNRFERLENAAFCRRCCYHVYKEGHIPFASHLFFPEFLNEDDPVERKAGIEGGYFFWQMAGEVWFFVERGWSPGMRAAHDNALFTGKPIQVIGVVK
jgi:hypothetical protein